VLDTCSISIHRRLTAAYSLHNLLALRNGNSNFLITDTRSSSSRRTAARLTATPTSCRENCCCCCWNCDTNCWRDVISWSFWLRSDVNRCLFWRSARSRARISRSLAVTVARWALTTENLKRKKRGVQTKIGCGRVDWTCIFSPSASRLNNSSRSC